MHREVCNLYNHEAHVGSGHASVVQIESSLHQRENIDPHRMGKRHARSYGVNYECIRHSDGEFLEHISFEAIANRG